MVLCVGMWCFSFKKWIRFSKYSWCHERSKYWINFLITHISLASFLWDIDIRQTVQIQIRHQNKGVNSGQFAEHNILKFAAYLIWYSMWIVCQQIFPTFLYSRSRCGVIFLGINVHGDDLVLQNISTTTCDLQKRVAPVTWLQIRQYV